MTFQRWCLMVMVVTKNDQQSPVIKKMYICFTFFCVQFRSLNISLVVFYPPYWQNNDSGAKHNSSF